MAGPGEDQKALVRPLNPTVLIGMPGTATWSMARLTSALPKGAPLRDAHRPRRAGHLNKGRQMASVDFEGAMQEARAALDMIVKGDAGA